ncbi:hypothetical protein V9T40_005568 [Parthenolecanium corni]|uniref:Major facilitator superfamily (MFS) profile domain-containing protein n=1 Tax=Parthenolecanium corni TaxID=536013 RepID=A0AAN9YAX4_9HEMI
MELTDAKFYKRKRYLVAAFVFLGWIVIYILRMNLSINIVDMTSDRIITVGNETWIRKAEFNWSLKEKGLILSAFFWGYAASFLGAFVAEKYGGVTTFGTGIALTGLLTILSPILIHWNLTAYILARILEGVFEGISAATSPEVLRPWSTPAERSRLIGGVTSGYVLGTMLGFPLCGTIAYYLNWEAVFYITGSMAMLWCLLWFSLISNNPNEDTWISSQERQYLKQMIPSTRGKIVYPWKQIIRSKPVWAYWNDRFVEAWSTSFLTYCLPIFIRDVHNVNIQDIGILSGIPHFCGMVGIMGGSVLADYLRNSRMLSISNVHKMYLSFAQFSAVVLLIIAALWKNFLVNIICFSFFRLFYTVSIVSYLTLPVDIAGPYSCFICGFGFTSAAVSYSLNPIVMGLLVTDHSIAQWSGYFLLLSVFNLWAGIVFYKYGSGDPQPWAFDHDSVNTAKQQSKEEITSAN